MSLKTVTLIEDTPGDDPLLKNEHGLSFFIENEGHYIRTGSSLPF